MPASPLAIATILFQGFLLLVTLVFLLVFFRDLCALYRRHRARHQRFNHLLSLGTIWKPK